MFPRRPSCTRSLSALTQTNIQRTRLPSFSALRGTQNPVGFVPLVVQLDSDYSWSAVLIFPSFLSFAESASPFVKIARSPSPCNKSYGLKFKARIANYMRKPEATPNLSGVLFCAATPVIPSLQSPATSCPS
ncbi:hypothetical protein PTI98_011747 [Pleurotus ostreatus]|nr:hypothetical protein PTI98_011747 [Pleurotus ostreatus]